MRANLMLDEREHDSVVERAFEFRSPSEVLRISNELSTFCEEPLDACTAISELMLNAIEHGNLGIGGALKETLLREDRLGNEVERRLNTEPWCSRKADVHFKLTSHRLVVRIQDQGDGFDWRDLPKEPDFTRLNGRGVPLALALYFDKISFNATGNCCLAEKEFL